MPEDWSSSKTTFNRDILLANKIYFVELLYLYIVFLKISFVNEVVCLDPCPPCLPLPTALDEIAHRSNSYHFSLGLPSVGSESSFVPHPPPLTLPSTALDEIAHRSNTYHFSLGLPSVGSESSFVPHPPSLTPPTNGPGRNSLWI